MAIDFTTTTATGDYAPAAPTIPGNNWPTPIGFNGARTVTINAPAGSRVYYTLNGQRPSPGAPETVEYTAPIVITRNTTVAAIAVNKSVASEPVYARFANRQPVAPRPYRNDPYA